MDLMKLEDLPKQTLVQLARMYARNWQTLDGLWFGNVELEYGLDSAVRLDIKNWERQSETEARRLKKLLKLDGGGLSNVLKALSLMSWQLVSPLFEIEEESPERIVFYYPRCPVQEGRKRQDKPEFPCRTMKTTLLTNLAGVIEPQATLTCLACPPDPHPAEYWCKWELALDGAGR